MKHFAITLLFFFSLSLRAQTISGELRQWHDVTLTFDGPSVSESGNPNPFLDYRFNITFTQGAVSLTVPGYFAADGDAANTSATAGNKWRAHFRPPLTGAWTYTASFRQGTGVAIDTSATAGASVSFDGTSGAFTISPTNKTAPDFRAKGRLEYVGEHYRRFAGTGEWFLNVGADSPENLLAYWEFDQTANDGGANNDLNGTGTYFPGFSYAGDGLHHFAAHAQDWQTGDPTWGTGKGKNIIGALNYLASKGLNAYSALLWNVGGDGDDTWPFITDNSLDRFDCSKLDQWGVVFTHAEQLGLLFHAKLFETENDQDMTDAQWKLYFREMVARFGHHLAWEWNLGEENTMGASHITAQARYLRSLSSYPLHVVLHTYPANNWRQSQWGPQLGDSTTLTGISIQAGPNDLPGVINDWRDPSFVAGHSWTLNHDEQGSASNGVTPDPGYPGASIDNQPAQRQGAWRGFIQGLEGHKSYFGYNQVHNDLDIEDFRSRDAWWNYLRIIRETFYWVPFWDMEYAPGLDELSNDNFILTDYQDNWLVWAKDGDDVTLAMPAGIYEHWFVNAVTGASSYGGQFSPTTSTGGIALLNTSPYPGEQAVVIKRYSPALFIDLTPEEAVTPPLEDGMYHVDPEGGPDYYRIYTTDGRFVFEGRIVDGKIPAQRDPGLWVFQTYSRRWVQGVIQN